MINSDENEAAFLDMNMLPNSLLIDIGFDPKINTNPTNNPNNFFFGDKARTQSELAPTISIELPKYRQKKSSSLIQFNFLVSNPHGKFSVQPGLNHKISPNSYVLFSDGEFLRYGVVVQTNYNEEDHGKKCLLHKDKPSIRFIDKDRVLVPALIDRDKKALILLKLIVERMNIDDKIVFLETISFKFKAAFQLGHKYQNQEIVSEICNQLKFLYGCPVFPLFIE